MPSCTDSCQGHWLLMRNPSQHPVCLSQPHSPAPGPPLWAPVLLQWARLESRPNHFIPPEGTDNAEENAKTQQWMPRNDLCFMQGWPCQSGRLCPSVYSRWWIVRSWMGYAEKQCGMLLFVLNLSPRVLVREHHHCFSFLHTHTVLRHTPCWGFPRNEKTSTDLTGDLLKNSLQ